MESILMTAMSLVTRFEAYLLTEKRVSPNTFDAYQRDLAQFLGFLKVRAVALEKVAQDDIKAYLQHLKKT